VFLESSTSTEDSTGGPLRPPPQPAPPYLPVNLAPAQSMAALEPALLTAHDDNTLNFLYPFGFGYVRDRRHVAGFRAHQFRHDPEAPALWRTRRLELVGLLKYDEPVVYLSQNFPRMDELRTAPTRPLDPFENEALAGLRLGEDLIAQQTTTHLRMLGAIRAVRQCQRCHGVERGELLGAFSYQMERE
jgi:hypothetical protein